MPPGLENKYLRSTYLLNHLAFSMKKDKKWFACVGLRIRVTNAIAPTLTFT
jgi:hypothetical protein